MEPSKTLDRSFYDLSHAFDIKEQKIASIDSSDNVVVLGDKRGYIYAYDESIGPGANGGTESQYEMLKTGKRG